MFIKAERLVEGPLYRGAEGIEPTPRRPRSVLEEGILIDYRSVVLRVDLLAASAVVTWDFAMAN